MAVDLRCPHCEDNLGKDTENSMVAWCGNCATQFYNERGEKENLSKDDLAFIKRIKATRKKHYGL